MNTKRDRSINHIVACLAIFDPGAPTEALLAKVGALDAESIGVLHGISGGMRHAMAARMPRKWLCQIHSDLLDAFQCLCAISDDTRN